MKKVVNHHKNKPLSVSLLSKKTITLLSIVITANILSACSQLQKEDTEAVETPEPPKVVSYLVLGNKDANITADNIQANVNKPQNTNKQSNPIRKLSGQVVTAESTNLSFEASGKIKQLMVKAGDRVKKGQVLGVLDDTTYKLQQYQSEAQLKQAITKQKQAAANVKRRQELVEMGAVSKAEIDTVQFELQNANEAIQVALASVELNKKQALDTQLRAPFDGVIIQKLGEVGQTASPSIAIFSMASNAAPEIEFNAPENLLKSIRVGQTLPVLLPALPKLTGFVGRVTQVSTQGSSGTFPITLKLLNATPQIKAGMTAEVSLPITLPAFEKTAIPAVVTESSSGKANTSVKGFAVPPSAVGAGNNPKNPRAGYVYKIVPTQQQNNSNDKNFKQLGTIERVNITITGMANNTLYIHGNLNDGDKLVRTGVSILENKQQVELMDTGARRINP